MVEALGAAGADVLSMDNLRSTILLLAIENGCLMTVQALLDSGLAVDSAGLQHAATGRHVKALEVLLSSAARVQMFASSLLIIV